MIRRSASVVLAITIARLIAGRFASPSPEEALCLDALRRAFPVMADATADEIGSYLRALSPEQLRGVLSLVKGVYHELLVAAAENADGDEVSARLFSALNHPGADLEFLVDGEVIRTVQLKAVQTAAAIRTHFERYPDIDVLATSEVMTALGDRYGDHVISSGFSNVELTETTQAMLDELIGSDAAGLAASGAMGSALLAGALQARVLLAEGKMSRSQLNDVLGTAALGLATSLTLDVLLGAL